MNIIKFIIVILLSFAIFSCADFSDEVKDAAHASDTPPFSKEGPPEIQSIETIANTNTVHIIFDEYITLTSDDLSNVQVEVEREGTTTLSIDPPDTTVEVLQILVQDNKLMLILSIELKKRDKVYINMKEGYVTDSDQEALAINGIIPVEVQEKIEDDGLDGVDTSFVKYRDRPLWYALNYPNTKQKIDEALANGANINARWNWLVPRETFLMYAHSLGVSNDILEYIIAKGANPNVPSNQGNTILHNSAYRDSIERFKFIYNLKGINRHALNNAGEDVLYTSAALHRGGYGDWKNVDVQEKVEFLVSEGFSINRKKANGNTLFSDYIREVPLYNQESYDKALSGIDTLFNFKAEVDIQTLKEVTKASNYYRFVGYLNGATKAYAFFKKVYDRRNTNDITEEDMKRLLLLTTNPSIVKTLVNDYSLDLTTAIDDKYPLLEVLSRTAYNIKTRYVWDDALIDANWNNAYEIVDFYLDKGASILVKDSNGNSILNLVQNDVAIFEKYILKGAKIDLQDDDTKERLLTQAIGNVDLFKLLLDHGISIHDIENFEDKVIQDAYKKYHIDFLEYFATELVPNHNIAITEDYIFEKYTIWEQVMWKDRFSRYEYVPELTYRFIKALVEAGYNIEFKRSEASLTPIEFLAYQIIVYPEYFTGEDELNEYKRIFEYFRKALEEKTGIPQKTLEEILD